MWLRLTLDGDYMALSNRNTLYTLIGILLALFLGALDQTIVATALPRITEDLKGVNRYDWVVTAYLLGATVLVPIYGKLADMYSRKAIELVAVGIFLTGSFLCGLAGEFGTLPLLGDGMTQLIIFRAYQGAGGAGLFAMAFIIIADLFPPAERGRYQGITGSVFGISSVLGPVVGGFLTDHASVTLFGHFISGWRWVFYVNLPFGALALWFIISRMPRLEPRGDLGRFNYGSALLLVCGLLPFVLALRLDKTNPAFAWTAPLTLALFAVAAICLTAFSLRALHAKSPLIDLKLFRNKVFSTSNAAAFFIGAAFLSTLIFLPLFMIQVMGISATRSGLALVPLEVGIFVGSLVAGQLVSAIGRYRLLMLIGVAILFVGTLLLTRITPEVNYWQLAAYIAIFGLGVGPSFPLYTLAVQNAVDTRKIGQATSAVQFFRQIGFLVGLAVMGSVLAVSLTHSLRQSTAQLPGSRPISVSSERNATSADIAKQIEASFNEQYQAVAQAAESGNARALAAALNKTQLPPEAQTQIEQAAQNPQTLPGALTQLKTRFNQQAKMVAQQVIQTTKSAFTKAITTVFTYALALIVVAGIFTCFIPYLPLRKTNDHQEQAEVVAERREV